MNDEPTLDTCKAILCMKDQEIYMLNSEIARKGQDIQTLADAFERLEKTTSASVDRLTRSLERLQRRMDDRRR